MNVIPRLSFVSYLTVLKKLYTREKDNTQETFNNEDVIKEADILFENKKYQEAYKCLNHFRYYRDQEILWRICRVLFKLTAQPTTSQDVPEELINEAYNLIRLALSINEENAAVHKWSAIILNARNSYAGASIQIKNAHVVKQHLMRAAELNQDDFSVWYMLGYWCYSMSSFSWLQRKLVAFLYGVLPHSSYAEAYKYFQQAEELKPRFYIPNTCMLGKVSYLMNRHYRAKYYLNMAAHLTPHTDIEKKFVEEARKLESELDFFDLAKDAVLNDFAN